MAPKLSTDAANTTNLTVGGATAPITGFMGGTTPTFGPIRPGGTLLFFNDHASGFGVITPTTADVLRVTNSAGATAKYQIAILGRSA